MAIILELIDPRNKTIELSENIWQEHICNHHKEHNIQIEEISTSINNPLFIVQDNDYNDRNNYYGRSIYVSDPPNVKVVVDFFADSYGKVVTAFRASGKKGEKILWPILT